MADFLASYAAHKGYATPTLKPKHIRAYDRLFWQPAAARTSHRMLEIGCGTGLFLAYLNAKGVADFTGIDRDPKLAPHIPPEVADRFRVADAAAFLDETEATFDRVALFDVLEHFAPEDGARLLSRIRGRLAADGRVVVKVPNNGSPWGGQFQYGDLTHRTAYAPISLRQVAVATGFRCRAVLPVIEGSPFRRVADRVIQALLDRCLMTPPEVWTANLLAVFEPERG